MQELEKLKELKPSKTDLRIIATIAVLITFLMSYTYLLLKAEKNITIDTKMFELMLQTLLTLMSVAVGGWLFKELK